MLSHVVVNKEVDALHYSNHDVYKEERDINLITQRQRAETDVAYQNRRHVPLVKRYGWTNARLKNVLAG